MIDVKELHIGNYVTYSADNPACMAVLAKIEAIYGNFVNVSFSVYDDQGEEVPETKECVPVRELYPIELSSDILKRNSFEEFDSWLIYNQEETGIEISWLGTILKISGECGNLELPAIMYVHQLQNVLSICGIEKEIKL